MKKTFSFYFLALLIVLTQLLQACSNNPGIIENAYRFEQELFNLPVDSLSVGIEQFVKENQSFYSVFSEHIIGIGPVDEPNHETYLKQFVGDPVIREIFDETDKLFPDFSEQTRAISAAINQFSKQIGDAPITTITTYISGFNQTFVTLDKQLAIGLDNYLGSDCRFYTQLGIPQYVVKHKTPDQIVPDAVRAWITSEFPMKETAPTLLAQILHEGFILYAATQVLPRKSELKVFRYSSDDWDWCVENESAVWKYMIDQELLFSTDQMMIRRLTGEAPFSRDFSQNSPPRIGNWIGFRIVSKMMKKSGQDWKEVIIEFNAQEVLAKSSYRPG